MSSEPVRTCVACRRRFAASELIRVRFVDCRLTTDQGPGRGAWIGPSGSCVERVTSGALSRALRVEVNDDEVARLIGSWPTVAAVCPHTGNPIHDSAANTAHNL